MINDEAKLIVFIIAMAIVVFMLVYVGPTLITERIIKESEAQKALNNTDLNQKGD